MVCDARHFSIADRERASCARNSADRSRIIAVYTDDQEHDDDHRYHHQHLQIFYAAIWRRVVVCVCFALCPLFSIRAERIRLDVVDKVHKI